MKKFLLLITLIFLIPSLCNADPQLSKAIEALLKTFGDTASIGILVKDQNTGEVLYTKNSNHYYLPASNEKLLTAFAALQYLGENFTYKTQLFADPTKMTNGVLNDNVYLQFTGDPSFTFAQLDNLIQALSSAGVHRINGNIIVDDTFFDTVGMSPGTTWDDKDYCWGSPISAITIEHNCVKATLRPAAEPDKFATILLPESPQFLQFAVNAVTRRPDEANCTLNTKRTNLTTYTINGCIKTTDTPIEVEMAVDNPRGNLQFLLTYLLNKYQITGTHYIEFKHITTTPKLLASESSPPLWTLVKTMLKDSDNTIANAVFKTIGSYYAKAPGSFENGSEAVRDILHKTIQLDIPKTTLIDGDGASRYDYLTPEQIVTLLQHMYLSNHAYALVSALPIAGTDGTLKARMQNPMLIGKVYAKTGSETAVSTLSGFLQTHSKRLLVFSIMINGFVDLPSKYQDLEDKVCDVLVGV